MKTTLLKINSRNPELEKINLVSKAIICGKLVAFPTETVYGLGANAFDQKAISQIFKVKGRPQDNPLIVHIFDISQVEQLAKVFPQSAQRLIKEFWPGPLTIVLKKKKIVPKIVTAGLDSVAIRMPENKIALKLIKQSKVPIVAPSANLSGKPSPTKARHVIDDIFGKVDYIIDGGNCKIGIESTVIDFTSKVPTILRPGYITKEDIEKVIGKVEISKSKSKTAPKAPGMKYKHYSPKAKVRLISKNKIKLEIKKQLENKEKIAIITFNNKIENKDLVFSKDYNQLIDYSKNLFSDFRFADKKKASAIIVQEVPDQKFGHSIMNRLKKAAGS